MTAPKQNNAAPWSVCVLSLFPAMFPGPLGLSLTGRALEDGLWQCEARNIRDYATDKHRSVDDTPAGGGAGMVMRADVAASAIDAALADFPARPVVYLSPRGKPLTQALARSFITEPGLILFCGRFEGLDERVIEARNMLEVSIGDYVLSGGELAAMVLLDVCVRLLPGVLGSGLSLQEESFENGLLEYPHYTKPRLWEGREIPQELLSGNHELITKWRHQQAHQITATRRPDLLKPKDNAALEAENNCDCRPREGA